MKLYLTDPKNGLPSVTLTIMMVSFLVAVVAISLNIAKVTDNTSSSMELFLTTAGIYLGRRFTYKGNAVGSDDATPSSTNGAPNA